MLSKYKNFAKKTTIKSRKEVLFIINEYIRQACLGF